MLKTVRAQKVYEKKWNHLFSFHVPFLSYSTEIILKSAFFAI